MNIFKKTIFSVLFSLLIIGNVNADKIKIGTEDYRIIKKGNFYDFDFKDYVECAIMVEDGPSEETVGVSYFIQPMPKKYITKEDSEDSNNKFCPSCLKQIIAPGNFCTNCGNKLI